MAWATLGVLVGSVPLLALGFPLVLVAPADLVLLVVLGFAFWFVG